MLPAVGFYLTLSFCLPMHLCFLCETRGSQALRPLMTLAQKPKPLLIV